MPKHFSHHIKKGQHLLTKVPAQSLSSAELASRRIAAIQGGTLFICKKEGQINLLRITRIYLSVGSIENPSCGATGHATLADGDAIQGRGRERKKHQITSLIRLQASVMIFPSLGCFIEHFDSSGCCIA